jgi:hypothetical protein
MLLVALQIFTTLAFATTRHRRVGPWNIFLGRVVFNHRQGSSAVKQKQCHMSVPAIPDWAK